MLPAGIILLWHGTIGNIPDGYILCNGANGTPNLTNKFIVGAGHIYAVDDTGGNANHNHTFTSNGHNHTIPAGDTIEAGFGLSTTTATNTDTGTTANGSSLPPYHALAYIMKT